MICLDQKGLQTLVRLHLNEEPLPTNKKGLLKSTSTPTNLDSLRKTKEKTISQPNLHKEVDSETENDSEQPVQVIPTTLRPKSKLPPINPKTIVSRQFLMEHRRAMSSHSLLSTNVNAINSKTTT